MTICAFHSFAQTTADLYSIKNGAVVVENVIPFEVSKEIASAAVKSYFLTKLNDSNETLKNSSDDYYVAKIITPQLHRHSLGLWYTVGKLTIEVKFKENKMKCIISCTEIINCCTDNSDWYSYNPIEAAPISTKHNAWDTTIRKKDAIKTFDSLISYMYSLITSLNIAVLNAPEEEDW